MNEAVIQALMQGIKVFVVAGLTAFSADAANIVQIGTSGDPLTGPLVLSVITAVIVAILKAIGGATQKSVTVVGRGGALDAADRPSILAV